MPKSKRQLADEAWLRLNTPNEDGVLPGQLPLGDPPPVAASEPVFEAAPAKCPTCDRRMTLDHGWTPATPTESEYRLGVRALLCGFCGKRYSVEISAWQGLKNAIRERYLQLNAPKPKAQPKRARGAR